MSTAAAGRTAPARSTIAGLLALAALTLLLHHRALQGSWRNDDPMLLAFAAAFSPAQYFFTREGMLQLSYASTSPWAGLFFDGNLALFGLAPRGHYAHQLLLLWATAAATAIGLRRWLDAPAAWGAGALFLGMPPTGAIAQQLMTGHYAWGLLFSVLALWAFARAVQHDDLRWACAAAALYGLAALCKELYVTLPAVLLAWPGAAWRRRLRCGLPVLAVAIGYAVMRVAVLGGIGGYAVLQADRPALPGWDRLAFMLQQMLAATLGAGPRGVLALLALGALAALGWRRGRRPSALLLAGAAVTLLLPSLPAFGLGSRLGYGNDRIAFALGWAVAVFVGWQVHGMRWWPATAQALPAKAQGPSASAPALPAPAPALPASAPALPVSAQAHPSFAQALPAFARALPALAAVALLSSAQRDVSVRTMAQNDPRNAEYRFLAEAAADQVLVPQDFNGIGYLDRLAEAMQRVDGRRAARIVRDEDELAALGPAAGRAAWAWRADCDCLRPLGNDYEERLRAHQRRLQAGAGRPLRVDVQLDGRSPRKLLQWTVSGAPADVQVEVRGVGRFPLAAQGSFAFGIDYGTPIGDVARVRFLVTAADGALQRSDWIELPLQGLQSAHWSAGPVAR